MMSVVFFLALLILPVAISFVSAYFAGRLMGRTRLPDVAAVSVAGFAGMLAPVIYLWVWQSIEMAIRQANGDTSDYMGPLVILAYGFPIFIVSSVLCFPIAAYGRRVTR